MMKNKYHTKRLAKKVIRKSLLITKKTASKSQFTRRIGHGLRNVLFPVIKPTLYNYSRYAPSIAEYLKQREEQMDFKLRPLISIVMPTYNTPTRYLNECIESVIVQSYSNWEFCIADDASPDKEVIEIIEKYANQDKRIKLVKRKENGHISAATNSAIDVSKGEFIALLDHDDLLSPNALYEVIKQINKKPDTDFIYTDEDKIDDDNMHTYPFFKPDWSPEFLESCNYITHFSVLRRELINKVGGLRVGYEGAQDWDLFLRVTEQTSKIEHIPKILYSWRIHDASTAKNTDTKPYVYEAQRKLLEDHITRAKKEAAVRRGIITQHSSIEYAVEGEPLISIVLAGNWQDKNKKTITSILNNKTYDNYELIIVDPQTPLSKKILNNKNLKVVNTGKTNNLAASFNAGAATAEGEYIVFLENSMVMTSKRWLQVMLADSQRESVGVVGGKVLNEEGILFLRAGCATGIFSLYAPLLEGMPVTDIHYMRGLYGQSRRNVSVLDGYFMVKKDNYLKVGGFDENASNLFYADFCLSLLQKGFRNVYNPYVQAADLQNSTAANLHSNRDKLAATQFKQKWSHYIDNDPYLNPNFARNNAQMDFKYG